MKFGIGDVIYLSDKNWYCRMLIKNVRYDINCYDIETLDLSTKPFHKGLQTYTAEYIHGYWLDPEYVLKLEFDKDLKSLINEDI